MHNHRNQPAKNPNRFFRKFFLSAFVVFSFVAYALHKPFETTDGSLDSLSSTSNGLVSQSGMTPTAPDPSAAGQIFQQGSAPTAASPQPQATIVIPLPTATPSVRQAAGRYKDGSYTGIEIDAFYGLVRVQMNVQNGKIASVKFLEYPNDRRTSVRINSFAVPRLQQEAVQVQSANVNMITGATLTSQAFMMSLQSAISQAQS
jgi:uncharacterized protein with FMN-binding domain